MSTAMDRDVAKLKAVVAGLETSQIQADLNALCSKWEKMKRSAAAGQSAGAAGNGDELVKTQMALRGDDDMTWGFQKWVDSRILPANPLEALILGIHSLFLESSFTNLTRVPSTVPGFAPSIREVNPSKFIPDQWESTVVSEGLLYKHPTARSPFQLIIGRPIVNEAVINLSQKNKVLCEMTVNVASLIDITKFSQESLGSSTSLSPYQFFSNLEHLKDTIVSPLIATTREDLSIPTSMMAPDRSIEAAPRREPEIQRPEGLAPPLRVPPISVGGVGSSDLNPAGVPDFDHRPQAFPSPEGGGSLVGPGHPLFGGDPSGLRDRDPGYPAFPRAPQPRFDPYGPVPGANGPDFGPGIPGRPFPGEPEPDHLKPPGIPDIDLQPPSRLRDPRDPRRPGPGGGIGGRIFER